jgi:hypothetical protein
MASSYVHCYVFFVVTAVLQVFVFSGLFQLLQSEDALAAVVSLLCLLLLLLQITATALAHVRRTGSSGTAAEGCLSVITVSVCLRQAVN